MSTAAAAPAASKSDLYARLGVSEVIFVEEMERRQADVGDFLLIESGDPKRRRILPAYVGYRSGSRRYQRRGSLAIRPSTPPKTPRRCQERIQFPWRFPFETRFACGIAEFLLYFPSTNPTSNVLHPLALFCDAAVLQRVLQHRCWFGPTLPKLPEGLRAELDPVKCPRGVRFQALAPATWSDISTRPCQKPRAAFLSRRARWWLELKSVRLRKGHSLTGSLKNTRAREYIRCEFCSYREKVAAIRPT